jgi:hypothetical protein
VTELYPGEYADLKEHAQSECEEAAAADARLATLTPGTPEYDAAAVDCYYCDLAAGHALWELEQYEKVQARA